jgi:hypothetical protein
MTEDYPTPGAASSILSVVGSATADGGSMPHALDSALDPFRPGFEADGFDVPWMPCRGTAPRSCGSATATTPARNA